MNKAKVKWYNQQKCFGFLTTEDGRDVFVHWTELQDSTYKTLMEGQKVTFDLYETAKGLTAKNVVIC